MADEFPDRLSLDPTNPHFDADVLKRGVGIKFNGQEKINVEEYCISEGWIRVAAGRSRDRRGRPMTLKLNGRVEPYYSDVEDKPDGGGEAPPGDGETPTGSDAAPTAGGEAPTGSATGASAEG